MRNATTEMYEIPAYSTEALNVLYQFHDCDVIIFVEGDDDVLFWNVISAKAGIIRYRIEVSGGKNELNKKIEKVVNENAQIIIACDSDHSPFCENTFEHKQIVKTYGYSIENSMYCPKFIAEIIKKLSRKIIGSDPPSEKRMNQFVDDAKKLLIYDIANHRYQKGISVFGDNCSIFLKSNRSTALSIKKIETFIESIKTNFRKTELLRCEELVNKDSRELRCLIKGHFLTNVVINIIKERVSEIIGHRKSGLFTTEHLYTSSIDYCNNCKPSNCKELSSMVRGMKVAYAEVKKRQQEH